MSYHVTIPKIGNVRVDTGEEFRQVLVTCNELVGKGLLDGTTTESIVKDAVELERSEGGRGGINKAAIAGNKASWKAARRYAAEHNSKKYARTITVRQARTILANKKRMERV